VKPGCLFIYELGSYPCPAIPPSSGDDHQIVTILSTKCEIHVDFQVFFTPAE
jgi:hypothetical protein